MLYNMCKIERFVLTILKEDYYYYYYYYYYCNQNVFWSQNMVKMLWRAGLRPGPRWGSLQRSPRPLAGFWEGKMGKRKGGEEMSERREKGGGTKRRGREMGERRRRGSYWSALPTATSEPWRHHWSFPRAQSTYELCIWPAKNFRGRISCGHQLDIKFQKYRH